jgi:hypothetical protein
LVGAAEGLGISIPKSSAREMGSVKAPTASNDVIGKVDEDGNLDGSGDTGGRSLTSQIVFLATPVTTRRPILSKLARFDSSVGGNYVVKEANFVTLARF